jgi:alpha-N-arabinofuranosidase
MAHFQNPILPGCYPDPAICRVGEDYFLVTSSFAYFPGIPIFQSRDLVHWKQLGHCLDRKSQLNLDGLSIKDGIWAPAISHSGGQFYVTATLMKKGGGGNFLVKATDAAGPWSEPVWVDQPGIDPSLFFDDEGKCYYLTTHCMPGRSRNDIVMAEIDPATGQRLSDLVPLWSGIGELAPEGPHLYKIGGRYYLMIAEGGTYGGHMENIARSESLWGPYEGCPRNPILTHRHNHHLPIQFAGHGDLVEMPDGTWWMVHLGVRCSSYQKQHLGRETFLVPVSWDKEGWPLVNEGKGITELKHESPQLHPHPWAQLPCTDNFDEASLDLRWNHLGNPVPNRYSLSERPGWLRLRGSVGTLSGMESPTFIGRRQQEFVVNASICIEFEPLAENEEAGLAVYMSPDAHYTLSIMRRGEKREVILKLHLDHLQTEIARQEVPAGPLTLAVESSKETYTFSFAQNQGPLVRLGEAPVRYLCAEVADTFTGVYLGLYATGNGSSAASHADFDWFEYKQVSP